MRQIWHPFQHLSPHPYLSFTDALLPSITACPETLSLQLRVFLHTLILHTSASVDSLQTALCYLEAIEKKILYVMRDQLLQTVGAYNSRQQPPPPLISPLFDPLRVVIGCLMLATETVQHTSQPQPVTITTDEEWADMVQIPIDQVSYWKQVIDSTLHGKRWVCRCQNPKPSTSAQPAILAAPASQDNSTVPSTVRT